MTNIDDSTQTPPGYWVGVIDGRLHQRMRETLAGQGLRRGGWRILHTLAEGPATPDELGEKLPHRGTRDRHHDRGRESDRHARYGGDSDGDPRGWFAPGGHPHAHGHHPGWRGQEPRDERPAGPDYPAGPEHEHHDRAPHHGTQHAFERGYEHGFDRGYAFGAARAGHAFAAAFPAAPFGPFHGGHPFAGPFAGGGAPFPGHFPSHFPGGFGGPFPGGGAPFGHQGQGGGHPFGHGRGGRGHRIHRIQRILADFVERGWVWFDGDRATLTDEGRAAHDTALERVTALRAELVDGIAEDDYATTMAALETMARNLGWRPAQHDREPGSPTEGEPKMEA